MASYPGRIRHRQNHRTILQATPEQIAEQTLKSALWDWRDMIDFYEIEKRHHAADKVLHAELGDRIYLHYITR